MCHKPLSQALQQARQTDISTGGWAPVHVHDRGAMRGQLLGEEFQA
jgi:hypothetical protein